MPELPGSLPDLTRYTEATRRTLYDRVVQLQFTPPAPATVEHPEDVWIPTYTPDDAGLTVFRVLGRWFATWADLDAPADLPEDRRVELVRIDVDPDTPHGIMLYEV